MGYASYAGFGFSGFGALMSTGNVFDADEVWKLWVAGSKGESKKGAQSVSLIHQALMDLGAMPRTSQPKASFSSDIASAFKSVTGKSWPDAASFSKIESALDSLKKIDGGGGSSGGGEVVPSGSVVLSDGSPFSAAALWKDWVDANNKNDKKKGKSTAIQIQKALVDLGLLVPKDVDGDFGKKSYGALKKATGYNQISLASLQSLEDQIRVKPKEVSGGGGGGEIGGGGGVITRDKSMGETSSWWSSLTQNQKIAVVGGSVAVVGIIAFLALRKPSRTATPNRRRRIANKNGEEPVMRLLRHMVKGEFHRASSATYDRAQRAGLIEFVPMTDKSPSGWKITDSGKALAARQYVMPRQTPKQKLPLPAPARAKKPVET